MIDLVVRVQFSKEFDDLYRLVVPIEHSGAFLRKRVSY